MFSAAARARRPVTHAAMAPCNWVSLRSCTSLRVPFPDASADRNYNRPVRLPYPASAELSALRRQSLDRLREMYQQLSPFKFIVYSGWAGAELPPLAAPARSELHPLAAPAGFAASFA